MKQYSHDRYGTVTGHGPVGDQAVVEFTGIVKEMELRSEEWIAYLRLQGVKAAHPDDGWVNRMERSVQLVYPQFNDGLGVGDRLALGWADSAWRIVIVTKIEQGALSEPHYFFK